MASLLCESSHAVLNWMPINSTPVSLPSITTPLPNPLHLVNYPVLKLAQLFMSLLTTGDILRAVTYLGK